MSRRFAGLSRRERGMIGAALAVALGIGLPALLSPGAGGGSGSLPELQRRRREGQKELAAARRQIEQLQSRIGPQLAPGTSRKLVRRMILTTQAAAHTAGMRVGDLKPLPVETVSGLQRVPVQVTASAPFSRSVRFLYELQRPQQAFHVESVRLSAAAGGEDRIELELRLVGFLQGEAERNTDDAGS